MQTDENREPASVEIEVRPLSPIARKRGDAGAVNVIRLKDLRAAGAQTIAAACPHCLTMLESARALDRGTDEVRIADIAELVAAALPEDACGAGE